MQNENVKREKMKFKMKLFISGAIQAGHTASGEPLFVGRAHYLGSHTIGKVQPSHGSLYIAFGGAEIPIKEYEILVEN